MILRNSRKERRRQVAFAKVSAPMRKRQTRFYAQGFEPWQGAGKQGLMKIHKSKIKQSFGQWPTSGLISSALFCFYWLDASWAMVSLAGVSYI